MFKTVFKIEVLSEEQLADGIDLEQIAYQITDGPCSGLVTIESCDEVSTVEMAQLLLAQGSDPGFFMLDEDGNYTEEA